MLGELIVKDRGYLDDIVGLAAARCQARLSQGRVWKLEGVLLGHSLAERVHLR